MDKKIRTTVINIIDSIKKIDYNSNTFADKKHEKSVKNILLKYGLKIMDKIPKDNVLSKKNVFKKNITKEIIDEFNLQQIIKDKNNRLKFVKELEKEFLFIEQPFGSQNSPDFIACIYGYMLWIECKSGKNGNDLQWNSGMPRVNVLYVYSTKKSKQTSIFFGQSTILLKNNPSFEEEYDKMDDEEKVNADKKFQEKFNTEGYTSLYPRRMLVDRFNYDNEEFKIEAYKKVIDIIEETTN